MDPRMQYQITAILKKKTQISIELMVSAVFEPVTLV
jgi:hypothetical protein